MSQRPLTVSSKFGSQRTRISPGEEEMLADIDSKATINEDHSQFAYYGLRLELATHLLLGLKPEVMYYPDGQAFSQLNTASGRAQCRVMIDYAQTHAKTHEEYKDVIVNSK